MELAGDGEGSEAMRIGKRRRTMRGKDFDHIDSLGATGPMQSCPALSINEIRVSSSIEKDGDAFCPSPLSGQMKRSLSLKVLDVH